MNRFHKLEGLDGCGFFYIDHDPTGKVITGSSVKMGKEIKVLVEQIRSGKHPNKTVNKLYSIDPDFRVRIVPCANLKAAKAAEKEFRATKATYLLLN